MLSLAVALPMAGVALTSLTAEYVQTRWGVGAAAAVGGGLTAAALVGIVFFPESFLLLLWLALAGVGGGLALPALNSIGVGAAGKDQRGAVTALYGGLRSLGAAVAPAGFLLFLRWHAGAPFLIVGAVVAVLTWFIGRRARPSPTEPRRSPS